MEYLAKIQPEVRWACVWRPMGIFVHIIFLAGPFRLYRDLALRFFHVRPFSLPLRVLHLGVLLSASAAVVREFRQQHLHSAS